MDILSVKLLYVMTVSFFAESNALRLICFEEAIRLTLSSYKLRFCSILPDSSNILNLNHLWYFLHFDIMDTYRANF